MTETPPPETPPAGRRRPASPPARRRGRPSRFARGAGGRTAALASVLMLFVVIAIAAGVAYGFRREVARQLLTGWLDEHGVESEVTFEHIELNGLVASLRAGPADDPDLVVERIEVDYALGLPGGAFSVTPTRIRVIRPTVKATFEDGAFSLGSLDPVIEDFARRPPSDDRGGPLILIEGARARLITPGGEVSARGYARLERGRLISLDAGVPAARLRDGERMLNLAGALVSARSRGDRLTGRVAARIESATGPVLRLGAGRVGLELDTPYPDTRLRRADGPVRFRATTGLSWAEWEGGAADDLDADLSFDGRANGWIETFALLGALTGEVRAGRLDAGGASVTRAAMRLDGGEARISRRDDLSWRYQGDALVSAASARQGDLGGEGVVLRLDDALIGGGEPGVEARGQMLLAAQALNQGDLALTGVDGRFAMEASFTGASLINLTGSVRSRGGRWPVLGAPTAQDVPEQAALKRAFGAFALSAPGLAIRAGSPGTMVRLTQAAVIQPANGGRIVVSALPGQALFAARSGEAGGGGLNLTAAGGGLPDAQVRVSRYAFEDGVLAARLDGRAGLDFGLARDIDLTTAGRLTIAGGRTQFQPDGCSPLTVGLLEMGENDVSDVSASICPGSEPLLVIADGWRFRAQVQGLSATAPFLGMAFSDGAGRVAAADAGRGLTMDAVIETARVRDTENPLRFYPLRAAGVAALANEDWTGAFTVSDRDGGRLAELGFRHAGSSQSGGLTIDARGLTFDPTGLQPSMLTPLTDGILTSPVTGVVDFTGGFDWTPSGAASQGVVSTQGLDFTSPAGPVTGLTGRIELTSLTPLATAPGQHVTIRQIDAAVLTLTEAQIGFELSPEAIRLGPSAVSVAGGVARIEGLTVPLAPGTLVEGVLVLDRVQLGDLLTVTGELAESVHLDAVVSGRLPFVAGPNGVTIIEGEVHAVQPGRLSIQRDALVGMQADGGGEQVPPNAVQDFAYQALENLSFDQLEATVNTLPQGRIGLLFTIHGWHDPPVEQELILTWLDVIRQRFMEQELPLPSGTEVNLTLDTSFNLDQLIADLMEIQRARSGQPPEPDRSDTVQPEAR